MTNAEIISAERFCLIKEGKITVDETIHTFIVWKQLGYNIKKGEHAIAKFPIWKHVTKTTKDGEEKSHMFMKMSCFFSTSQVEEATA